MEAKSQGRIGGSGNGLVNPFGFLSRFKKIEANNGCSCETTEGAPSTPSSRTSHELTELKLVLQQRRALTEGSIAQGEVTPQAFSSRSPTFASARTRSPNEEIHQQQQGAVATTPATPPSTHGGYLSTRGQRVEGLRVGTPVPSLSLGYATGQPPPPVGQMLSTPNQQARRSGQPQGSSVSLTAPSGPGCSTPSPSQPVAVSFGGAQQHHNSWPQPGFSQLGAGTNGQDPSKASTNCRPIRRSVPSSPTSKASPGWAVFAEKDRLGREAGSARYENEELRRKNSEYFSETKELAKQLQAAKQELEQQKANYEFSLSKMQREHDEVRTQLAGLIDKEEHFRQIQQNLWLENSDLKAERDALAKEVLSVKQLLADRDRQLDSSRQKQALIRWPDQGSSLGQDISATSPDGSVRPRAISLELPFCASVSVQRGASPRLRPLPPGSPRMLSSAKSEEALVVPIRKSVEPMSPAPSPSPSARSDHPESRLRELMTRPDATVEALDEAIKASQALLDEAARELQTKRLRAKRFALEQLHKAISHDEESEIADALEEAHRTGVDGDDVKKAEDKLAELRAMTDEQRREKALSKLKAKRKEEAFRFVKKDDVPSLSSLIENLEEGLKWQDWRDYAGRSLLKCARELKAQSAQKYLETLEAASHPVAPKSESRLAMAPLRKRSLVEAITADEGENEQAFEGEDVEHVAEETMTAKMSARDNIIDKGQCHRRTSKESSGSRRISRSTSGRAGEDAPETVITDVGAEESPKEAHPEVVPEPLSDEEVATLKQQAFRAVVQDDIESLTQVLARVPESIWKAWSNKAGRDLLTLAQERGKDDAYATLAKACGLVVEKKRDTYAERECVWVLERGDVQARRATVLEDCFVEDDTVLLEFWDGTDPPSRVDRWLVMKSNQVT